MLFDLNLGQLRATGLDQIGDLDPAMGIQGCCQVFLLLVVFPGLAGLVETGE